jgi:hypothetical protein
MGMAKLRRLYEQLVEAGAGEQREVLVGGEEQPVEDVVGITKITTTTIMTTTTMMMEVDLLAAAVGVLLGEEAAEPVPEGRGVEGAVLRILVQPETGGLAMVRSSLLSRTELTYQMMPMLGPVHVDPQQ